MISSKTIALNVAAKDWREAVRISGKLLVDSGSVEEQYIEAMIETVNARPIYRNRARSRFAARASRGWCHRTLHEFDHTGNSGEFW